ncbi:Flp family type IVb pilin [Xylophilus sp.]|uniref:Flp family type IVb pilin n=1 Tax=Xylophilus sp. TaxID=2653893 RepID=UPI0013BB1EDD|nr:Flp family type IVb pilin [Xylophilus sp.]KAF1046398.1 MAG: hypothetical protein GAK38_02465 [Xylophilus sp.]
MRKEIFLQFVRDEEGATAIEYALIVGLIAVGLIVSLESVRSALATFYGTIVTKLTALGAS